MYVYIHRKDLRSNDLRSFDYVRRSGQRGFHLLIIDPSLADDDRLSCHSGRTFLSQATSLLEQYKAAGEHLHVLYGDPAAITEALLLAHPIEEVLVHMDYTPYARIRDQATAQVVRAAGRRWLPLDDAPLADLEELHTFSRRSEPYKVFTPFYRMWQSFMQSHYSPAGETTLKQLDTLKNIDASIAERFSLPREHPAAAAFLRVAGASGTADAADRTSADSFAVFEATEASVAPADAGTLSAADALEQFLNNRLAGYEGSRDQFAENQTSHLARYLNTGALSARQAYEAAQQQYGAESWIRQLAWRDFFLYQGKYNEDFYRYEQKFDLSGLNDQHFEAWSQGKTGIPVIDAAMKQLNETGEMPNRLRMVTAMFLTKNLLCPFTQGEQHFRRQLADYDNTLNRGGWLWSSSLGYDAAPYFRIMNPATQSATHDPSGTYIRRWLPELAHLSDKQIHLPQPHAIVDLKASRARAIEVYKEIV